MRNGDNDIEFHPLAAVFPLIDGLAFRELVEDIRVHGLREPILLHDGKILDGRNRYRACAAAQVAVRFKTYDGKDALAFVVSANLHRRHLDASQRAMVAAELSAMRAHAGRPRKDGRRDRGGRLLPPRKGEAAPAAAAIISATDAGRLLSVSAATVLNAQHVLAEGAAELVDAVKAGDVSVSAAKDMASLPREQQRSILKSGGPDAVAVIGRQVRTDRLQARRVARAAQAESAVAVFDHIKVGDGRSIGSVRKGEIVRLAESLQLVVDVLLAVDRYGNADHGERIRDIVTEKTLAEMIDAARSVRAERSA